MKNNLLSKQANPAKLLASAGRSVPPKAKQLFSRYAELLSGGNQAIVADRKNLFHALGPAWLEAALKKDKTSLNAIGQLARTAWKDSLKGNKHITNVLANGQPIAGFEATPELAKELRKVYLARSGTAAVAGGAVTALSGKKQEKKANVNTQGGNTMTSEQAAYLEGFCKAAEAYGIGSRAVSFSMYAATKIRRAGKHRHG